jgi:hypothetical protein
LEGAFYASELGEPNMSKNSIVLNTLCRRLVLTLGVGATGAAISAVGTSDSVFAKQFACSAVEITLPEMTYDPELQMMVHPVTRQPLYETAGKMAAHNPTVTAGCKTCPKCDDYCK